MKISLIACKTNKQWALQLFSKKQPCFLGDERVHLNSIYISNVAFELEVSEVRQVFVIQYWKETGRDKVPMWNEVTQDIFEEVIYTDSILCIRCTSFNSMIINYNLDCERRGKKGVPEANTDWTELYSNVLISHRGIIAREIIRRLKVMASKRSRSETYYF